MLTHQQISHIQTVPAADFSFECSGKPCAASKGLAIGVVDGAEASTGAANGSEVALDITDVGTGASAGFACKTCAALNRFESGIADGTGVDAEDAA